MGLELLARQPELGRQPGARRQVGAGGAQVAAQEVDGTAVQQHGGTVVGVEVGQQRHGRVELRQRFVEPPASQRDQPVELVDQGVQVAPVAGGRRGGRGRGGRLPAFEAVHLELRERAGDEQARPGVQPLRAGPGVLFEQGEAPLDEP